MIILVGDIGGTHSRLAHYEYKDNRLTCLVDKVYPSAGHSGLEEIVRKFVARHGERATIACFGVAGPVRNGRARITNLPWMVDASSLEQGLGLARAIVINDLEAIAYSVGVLEPEDLTVVNPGDSKVLGNAGVIASGTVWARPGSTGTGLTIVRSHARAVILISRPETNCRTNYCAICAGNLGTSVGSASSAGPAWSTFTNFFATYAAVMSRSG